MEMAAEVAFPASETTSNGLMVFCGQIQSAIYIQMIGMLSRRAPELDQVETCSVGCFGVRNKFL